MKDKCKHNCDLINWDTANYQCPFCGQLVNKYQWLKDKLSKVASNK